MSSFNNFVATSISLSASTFNKITELSMPLMKHKKPNKCHHRLIATHKDVKEAALSLIPLPKLGKKKALPIVHYIEEKVLPFPIWLSTSEGCRLQNHLPSVKFYMNKMPLWRRKYNFSCQR